MPNLINESNNCKEQEQEEKNELVIEDTDCSMARRTTTAQRAADARTTLRFREIRNRLKKSSKKNLKVTKRLTKTI